MVEIAKQRNATDFLPGFDAFQTVGYTREKTDEFDRFFSSSNDTKGVVGYFTKNFLTLSKFLQKTAVSSAYLVSLN